MIDFEISDLPPPDTVAGLWQDVATGDVPMRVHMSPSASMWVSSTM